MSAEDETQPRWERGYRCHGLWLDRRRIGLVSLKPHGLSDGLYTWEAGHQSGEARSLSAAKKAVQVTLNFSGPAGRPDPIGAAWLKAEILADGVMAPEHAALISEKILQVEDWSERGRLISPFRAKRYIQNFDFFNPESKFGWLTPDGTFLGCSYAAHDRLVEAIGRSVGDMEQEGWIRITQAGVKALRKPTPAQRRELAKRGLSTETGL